MEENSQYKFRAWHKKRKKYYPVLHLHIWTISNGGIWVTCEGYNIISQQEVHIQIQPEDCIIEQITGAKDKTGTDIYDGDIIRFDPHEWGDNTTNIHVVRWNSREYSWCFGGGSYADMCFRTVIGNVHQNKELLKI